MNLASAATTMTTMRRVERGAARACIPICLGSLSDSTHMSHIDCGPSTVIKRTCGPLVCIGLFFAVTLRWRKWLMIPHIVLYSSSIGLLVLWWCVLVAWVDSNSNHQYRHLTPHPRNPLKLNSNSHKPELRSEEPLVSEWNFDYIMSYVGCGLQVVYDKNPDLVLSNL